MGSFLGLLQAILFIAASIFQLVKVIIEGNADGLSSGLIWCIIVGLIAGIIYTCSDLNYDIPMLLSLGGQLICMLIVALYKYFPIKR